jgi:hypothetical protein
MTVVLFILVTTIVYFLLFRFAVSRLQRRLGAPEPEETVEPLVETHETVDEPAWTALDDRQLDRLLRESSP